MQAGKGSSGKLRSSPETGARTRAFINMHAQTENAGDALVLRELIRLVSWRIPADVYLKDAPEAFIQELDLDDNSSVTAHRGDATITLIRDIVKARFGRWRCYYFLTAGAPHGERTPKQFVTDIVRIIWLALLTALGVRVCQVGVSFENIGPRHARILRLRSRILYASVPRDQITYDYMGQLGIRATAIMPDVTINLFATPPTPYGHERRGIAFSFRVDKDSTTRVSIKQIVKEVCEDAQPDNDLIFVGQVARDIPFMRELADFALSIRPDQVRFLDCHQDIDAAFATYRTCSAVLSNRLHALLPALKEGASPVALTVPALDPKITGVFESIGLAERIIDVRTAKLTDIRPWMDPMTFDGSVVARELNKFFDELLGTQAD